MNPLKNSFKVLAVFFLLFLYCYEYGFSRHRMYKSLTHQYCVPCNGGIPPLTNKQEDLFAKQIDSWSLNRNFTHCLTRTLTFSHASEAFDFITNVADIAEEEGHHPDIYLFYNQLRLDIHTHAVKGLTKSDFILAAKISELYDNKDQWRSNNLLNASFKTLSIISDKEYKYYMNKASGWSELNIFHSRLTKRFTFKNFIEAMNFVNKVWSYSIQQQHFPDIYIFWNTVRIDLHQRRAKHLSINLFNSAIYLNDLYTRLL